MREIKFRAWIKPDSEGNQGEMIFKGDKSDFQMVSNGDGFGLVFDMEHWLDKDAFKVMQYTGLKDKNGVEIYEGDILTPIQSQHFNAVVGWHESQGRWMTTESNPTSYVVWGHKFQLCEVIGNIYENPDLLEQK